MTHPSKKLLDEFAKSAQMGENVLIESEMVNVTEASLSVAETI